MIDVSKLRKSGGDRPEMKITPEVASVIINGHEQQVIRYDIPVDEYLANVGTVVSATTGKEAQGVGLVMKPIEFDYTVETKNERNETVLSEVRFVFEPSWRGNWCALKYAKVLGQTVIAEPVKA